MAYLGRSEDKKVYTSKGTTSASEFNFPAWVRLETQSASSSSSIEFNSFVSSDFLTYIVLLEQVDISGGSNLEMEISDDNGSTWQTSDYTSKNIFFVFSSSSWSSQSITDAFQLMTGVISGINGFVYLYNMDSTEEMNIYGTFTTASNSIIEHSFGRQTTLSNVNAVRFVPISTNTIDAGKFTLLGIYTG